MEGHCSTGQRSQRAVVPMEDEFPATCFGQFIIVIFSLLHEEVFYIQYNDSYIATILSSIRDLVYGV
jgi:hypothetical protein